MLTFKQSIDLSVGQKRSPCSGQITPCYTGKESGGVGGGGREILGEFGTTVTLVS